MSLKIDTIVNFQNGELHAFDDIYDACYNRVYSRVYQMIPNESTAKDVTQNVFIVVFEKLHQLKIPRAFYSWLDRITRNCALQEIKKSSKSDASFFNDEDSDQIIDNSSSPDETYNSQEIVRIIMTEIKKLPDGQKEVATLRFCDDLSIQEIASTLKIPEGTVKSRINTIRKELQENLLRKKISPDTIYSFLPILSLKVGIDMFKSLSIRVAETPSIAAMPVEATPWFINAAQEIQNFFQKFNVPIRTLATATVVVPLTFLSFKAVDENRAIVINDILYHDVISNEPLKIEFSIKNQDKIENIYVLNESTQQVYPVEFVENMKPSTLVDANGTYTLIIEGNKKEILSKDFSVSNLDLIAPEVLSITYSDNQLFVKFSEMQSTIDTNQSTVIIGENTIYASALEDEDTLVFKLPDGPVTGTVTITDKAGNYTKTEINLEVLNAD